MIHALTADGLTHPALAKHAPYDLVIANILAGPLTKLAPDIARALAPGAMVILSGLLRWQENLVVSFYRPQGLILRNASREGMWSALLLERPRTQA
jgi:ribosomal protein L11 methyltransferase